MPTPHALAGAFASRFARSPRVALVAGAFSHLALDRIPHTDYRLANRKVLLADLAARDSSDRDADPTPTGSSRWERSAACSPTLGWRPSCAPGSGSRWRCTTPITPRSSRRSSSACSPSYYAHLGSLSQVLSAVVATALWPLILLGANLHLSLANL